MKNMQDSNMELFPLPPRKTMYNALVNRDSSFEGIFFSGIRTTGIFCRPTCTARKPREENVEYFSSTKSAIDSGYRPCKVCRPMEKYGENPEWIKGLLNELNENPGVRIKDYELHQRGLDPARVRRWFLKTHGMTFQAFLRSSRINHAFEQIKGKKDVARAAYENGYESLSGFNEAFKKTTGFTPSESKNEKVVTIKRILSPLGPIFAGATAEGICLVEFTDRRMIETQINRLRKSLKAEFVQGESKHIDKLETQLGEYFNKKRTEFDVPLELTGSEFQKMAWDALMKIPYGETRSYQQQAIKVGDKNAVRAVARANGDNKISILIPCHRVIGKNGKLAGYGGGLWRKKYLIDLEQSNNK